jgi:hypothetical protein
MTGRIRKAASAIFVAHAVSAAGTGDASAQAVPYPLKPCKALAAELETSVPIPGPFTTKIAWFREGDLGIKGRQCHIAAEGQAKNARGAAAASGMEGMVRAVTAALEKHGFKAGKMVDRFTRKGPTYRAFAMRKERVTCWTNIEVQNQGPEAGAGTAPADSSLSMWFLTVECFKG